MKKVLCSILAFVFVIGICFSVPVTIRATEPSDVNKGFRFYLNEEGTAYELCEIYGKTGAVEIPAEHNGLPVESIDIYWQSDNESITSVTIPDSVKSIRGFNDFNSITEITFPEGLEYLAGFQNCSGLTEVVIPAGVKEIGAYSFSECLNLKSVVFKGNVDKIGSEAFSNCTALSDIEIKGDILELGRNIFKETAYYNNSENWSNYGLYIGTGLFAAKDVPETYVITDGTKAYASGAGMFENVTELTLSDDIVIIPDGGFASLVQIKRLEIPASVKIIRDGAGEMSLGSLEEIVLNDGLVEIGSEAFGEAQLSSITIPNTVIEIGNNAFKADTVYLGENVKDIDYSIINNANELILPENSANVEIENGVVYSGTKAVGCLKSTTGDCVIREGTTEIAKKAFYSSKITSVDIPDSVTIIGESTFAFSESLKTVQLSNNLKEFPIELFYYCRNLKNIEIPDGVTKIGALAFGYCSSITELTFPDSVVSMDYEIHRGNNSWEQIHNFEGCDKLTKLSYGANYDCKDFWSSLECAVNIEEIYISEKNEKCFVRNGVIYTYSNYENEVAVEIITHAFNGVFVIPQNMKKLSIENLITYDKPAIKTYVVEEGNEYFSEVDGVLYNKDKTELIAYDKNEETFTIPSTVTKIVSWAFRDNANLKEVVIPEGVTSIGSNAFESDSSLTSIVIPNTVTEIGVNVFSGCSNLTNVTMSNNVTVIPEYAFSGCRNLASLPVTDNVTEIQDYAFYMCSGLEAIEIPSNVEMIGNYAFSESMNLKSVALNKNLVEIGFQVFANCSQLSTITIDDEANIFNIGGEVLSETAYYRNENNWIDNGLYVGDYLFAVDNIINGTFSFKEGVKNFAQSFKNNNNLTNIVIPDSVIALSDYAFQDCNNLANIKLGKNVEWFGKAVFGFTNLVDINRMIDINENEYVNKNEALIWWNDSILFADKTYDGVVVIPEGIKEIPFMMFYGAKLSGVEFPDTLITIGSFAFSKCENLMQEVVIPDSVTKMHDEVFRYCTKLKKVELSSGLEVVPNSDQDMHWFGNCISLEEVVIPVGLNSIPYSTFEGCSSLKKINIPESVKSIGVRCFEQCSSLEEIAIPNTVESLGYAVFEGCNNLVKVTFSENLKMVGSRTFAGCVNLETVVLPNSLESIAESAFFGCTSLKFVNIPENVANIGEKALGYYNPEEVLEQQTFSLRTVVNSFLNSPKLYLAPTSESGDQKVEGFTMSGKKGSAAEQYARENRLEFVYTDSHTCSGGTATCTSKAVCSICGEEYGELYSDYHTNISSAWTTENGYHYHKCECGAKIDEAACFGGTATCTKKAVCVACNNEYGEINKANHSGLKTLDAVAPDCTNTGLTKGEKCFDCGETTVPQTVVKAKGHSLDSGKVTTSPTCIKPGEKTYSCTNSGCKFTKIETVPATGAHNQNTKIPGKAATCTATGLTEGAKCSVCGEITVAQKEIAKLAHNQNTKIAGKVATCTATGLTEGAKCSVCGEVTKAQQVIPATGHNSNTKIPGKAATCTQTGLTEGAKCSGCGTVTKAQQTVPATGHKPTLVGKKDATTKEAGYTGDQVCSVCNTVTEKGIEIPKIIVSLATPSVTIKNTAKGVEVTWNAIENAENYIVYRSVYNTSTKKWSKWSALKKGVTETSYVDGTVTLGTSYKYTVRAVNGDVMSKYVGTKGLKYDVKPTVKISNVATGVKVTWSTVANATGYTVYRSTYSGGKWSSWKNMGTAKANKTSWTDKNVKSGTQYKYTVRACYNKIKSSYTSSNTTVFLKQPTVKFSNATAGIKVSWSKVSGATGYTVYRSQLVDGKWTNWKNMGTAKSTKSSWTDKKVESGATYKYTVRAVNSKYKSSYTDTKGLLYLAQPTVTVKAVSNGINVAWSQCEGATGYTVYRSEYNTKTKKWSSWKSMGTAKATKSNWTDKKAKSGVKYKYTVRSVNADTGAKSSYVASKEIKR